MAKDKPTSYIVVSIDIISNLVLSITISIKIIVTEYFTASTQSMIVLVW